MAADLGAGEALVQVLVEITAQLPDDHFRVPDEQQLVLGDHQAAQGFR
ncbi:hypothetical protein OG937_45755 [Streptomyces sp. NBC_00510]